MSNRATRAASRLTLEADIWGIIPAAGAGTRMQGGMPKQYLPILGRAIILHTLERLCSYSRLRGVLVGIALGDRHWSTLEAPRFETFLGTFEGGLSRAKTVLNGLAALSSHAKENDWVMVHDAVRPCVRHDDLDKLVTAALDSDVGALLAAPIADTVKRSDNDGRVMETVSRAGLWRALTPQMFQLGKLRKALKATLAHDPDVTDESTVMERAGARPILVEGRPDNIKITHSSDLTLAEMFLKQQIAEQL